MVSRHDHRAEARLGFDTMGRINTMTDLGTTATLIGATTYGPANELLTMSGVVNEALT